MLRVAHEVRGLINLVNGAVSHNGPSNECRPEADASASIKSARGATPGASLLRSVITRRTKRSLSFFLLNKIYKEIACCAFVFCLYVLQSPQTINMWIVTATVVLMASSFYAAAAPSYGSSAHVYQCSNCLSNPIGTDYAQYQWYYPYPSSQVVSHRFHIALFTVIVICEQFSLVRMKLLKR